jgi:sulfur relay (sulfurtransferase) complex TusBCD TusD component (DsrE family)
MKKLKQILTISLVILLGISCSQVAPENETKTETKAEVETKADELLINLTSDATANAHSAFMGLHFAEKAQEDGIQVTVFLNVDGVKLLQEGADTLSFEDETLRGILDKIADQGGQVVACPHCMMIHGVDEASLPEKYVLGKPEVMFANVRKHPTVFTY